MARVAAVVILYHPDASVVANIASYQSHVEKVFLFDNSENPPAGIAEKFREFPHVVYVSDRVNHGISRRLNQGAKLAFEEGFDWLLTMDQDSSFAAESLVQYFHCTREAFLDESVAMVGVNFFGEKTMNGSCRATDSFNLITSGSILRLSAYSIVGGFDEALFIDEVDLEYCYRCVSAGYRTLLLQEVFLEHSLGVSKPVKSPLTGKVTNRSFHNPVRVYYMVRNYLYINKNYPGKFVENKRERRGTLLNRLKNNIVFGDRRFLTLRMVLRAYLDYLAGKMGKINKS